MNIVQKLEQHEEALRIKKLIFCLCKKRWENDTSVLNNCSLADILKELVQSIQTLDQLTFATEKLVQALNRPNVYANIAKTILGELTPLYLEYDSECDDGAITSLRPASYYGSDLDGLLVKSKPKEAIDLVVQSLCSQTEGARIKKLIFAVCKKRWENDLRVIENYGFKDLLLETCQIYPSRTELQIALTEIVENINKQALYLTVANIILDKFRPLYDTDLENSDLKPAGDRQAGDRNCGTQIVPIPPSPTAISELPRSQPASGQNGGTLVLEISEQVVTELTGIQPVSPPLPSKTYDLFELRQTIMQYTNPLRAKILMFSVLVNPWNRDNEDWSMLRCYTMDDLLEKLISSGQGCTEWDARLQSAAKFLTDTDADAQRQAICAIIKAIEPFVGD